MKPSRCVLLLLLPLVLSFSSVRARELTFAERVAAQRAIDRVYHAHQVGTQRAFDEIATDERLASKVRRSLKQSLALQEIWNAPLTAEALLREWERIERSTHDPERLQEIYRALGNDPFLIQEMLVRPQLVNHLLRGRFAGDPEIHAAARAEAETLREALARGAIDPHAEHARRSVREIERDDVGTEEKNVAGKDEPFARVRAAWPKRAGEIGPVEETEGGFEIRVVLEEARSRAALASYRVPKKAWEEWWSGVEQRFDASRATVVANDGSRPPRLVGPTTLEPVCTPNTWRRGVLADLPAPRSGHLAFWTGSLMLVWGGRAALYASPPGHLYDPLIDRWISMSAAGSPHPETAGDAVGVWTGSEMIVWNGSEGARFDPASDTWSTIAAGGPPSRLGGTAVWTGSEMIVWGGTWDGGTTFYNTGARYNLAANAWTSTTTVNAPTGRAGHSAVWTGTEMIVWGGTVQENPRVYDDSGGRYDPVLDSWTAMSTHRAEARGDGHVTVWTGTEMIVHGGYVVPFTQPVASGGGYNPSTNRWRETATGNAPAAAEHSAVWTGSEMIVAGGGLVGGARYNPTSDTWAQVATSGAPSARTGQSAVYTGARMLLWGGTVDESSFTSTGAQYDPVADDWSAIWSFGPRQEHTAVWTGNEMIVWAGASFGPSDVENSGARYDPMLGTWSSTSSFGAPMARRAHVAVWTGDRMVVWGGEGSTGGSLLDTGGRYDPASDSWEPMALPGIPGLSGPEASAVWTGSEMIVWGTSTTTGGRYDPASDSWTPTSPFSQAQARCGAAAAWTGEKMIVWGGRTASFTFLSDGGIYDPETNSWFYIWVGPNSPTPRNRHSGTWTGDRFVVYGGRLGGDLTAPGASYNPEDFLWTPITGGPGGGTAIWTGGRIVIWGGTGGLDRGGIYNPAQNTWLVMPTANAPLGTSHPTAVWTGGSMIVWGGDVGGPKSDGSEFFPDSDEDGLSDACDNCPLDANAGQQDQDADGIGDACDLCPTTPDVDADLDGVTNCTDCDDGAPGVHPGAEELCNGIDEDCNLLVDDDELGLDTDADRVFNACDNCRFDPNFDQGDTDSDAEGDRCDLDDGLIYILFPAASVVQWQAEAGFATWNSYRGDLAVLRATGVYTQVPGSNPLAERDCGLTSADDPDPVFPNPEQVAFWLVTGETVGGVENGLGTNSAGAPRLNANPCP